MSEHHKITPEEMSALLPDYEVSENSWNRVKKRLLGRLAVVASLYLLRLVIFVFFSEYHAFLIDHGPYLTEDWLYGIFLYRAALMVLLLFAYLYAIHKNAYLRTVAIIALIVTFAMLWSDIELLISHAQDFTLQLILPFVVRIAATYLLFKNYLDIRQ